MEKLKALRPRRSSGEFIAWRLIQPRAEESCRWQCVDGRWVALRLDATAGFVVVSDSSGREESVDSYEGGLALARSWRTT